MLSRRRDAFLFDFHFGQEHGHSYWTPVRVDNHTKADSACIYTYAKTGDPLSVGWHDIVTVWKGGVSLARWVVAVMASSRVWVW